MKVETDQISTADELTLSSISWIPEKQPIATLTFIHGYGEHIDRYTHVFPRFADAGIRVNSFDLRWHGKSQGIRGHTPSMDHIINDISLIVAKADPNLPHLIYGHSYGGGYAIIYSAKNPGKFKGVISSAPPIKLCGEVPRIKVIVGRWISKAIPHLRTASNLNATDLTRVDAVNQAYVNDPLNVLDLTLSTASILLGMGNYIHGLAPKVTAPILMTHGTDDKITSHAASKELFEKFPSSDKTFHSLDGWYHEPHNEPDKDQFIDFVLNWILNRVN